MQGWEPAEVTTFEYDGDRLVRAIKVIEPEWSGEERALLLASRELEFEPRNSVGIPLVEAMDPKHQFDWVPPELPTMDWAIKAADDKKDAYYAANKDASRNGHMWRPPSLKER